jgi:hypothetical protein
MINAVLWQHVSVIKYLINSALIGKRTLILLKMYGTTIKIIDAQ